MLRGAERWLAGYLRSVVRRERNSADRPRHLLLCIADHFEPFDCKIMPDGTVCGGRDTGEALATVRQWCRDYRKNLENFRDDDGFAPRHSFFYAWDEYDPAVLDELAGFCREGFGEVEIHLHHRNDSEAGLRAKLESCRDTFAERHGLLGRRERGAGSGEQGGDGGGGGVVYGFVHGNWCLCNARKDGDWCGVDRELAVLRETGCYADFTFPSAPSETQPRFVNEIVYGRDPGKGERGVQRLAPVEQGARSRERGERCGSGCHEAVMLVPGPLGLNMRRRKAGVLPRLENGELSGVNPPTVERLRLWQRIGVHVPGRPEWSIIKLHTHGARADNAAMLTGEAMAHFHRGLAQYCEAEGIKRHFVAARELFNIIKAAEAGLEGDPGGRRNRGITALY